MRVARALPLSLRPVFGLLMAAALVLGCSPEGDNSSAATEPSITPVTNSPQLNDALATPETQALYRNLARLSRDHMLFGHQDDLAYGVNWEGDEDRSDVRDVTGSNPAVYGWELGGLDVGMTENLDKVDFVKMENWIRAGYARGGVITISWHFYNLVTGGNSWDKTPAVSAIIPGGEKHQALIVALDRFADFNEALASVDASGKKHYVPIIFRPWHEHNGDWFWWGKGNTSEADYQALWRFTVSYLRDIKGIHNLIYAYSPDRGRINLEQFEQDYFWGYPGDDYVDLVGIDNYWDMGLEYNKAPAEQQTQDLVASLKAIVQIARQRNKIAALSETGNNRLTIPNFWTERLLNPILSDADAREIAYVLVWRNANLAREKSEQFYASFAGHPSAADFKTFYENPFVMFEKDLPPLYR